MGAGMTFFDLFRVQATMASRSGQVIMHAIMFYHLVLTLNVYIKLTQLLIV